MNRRGFLGSLAGVAALSIFFKKPPVFPSQAVGGVVTFRTSRKVSSGVIYADRRAYERYMERALPKMSARLANEIDRQLYGGGRRGGKEFRQFCEIRLKELNGTEVRFLDS